MILPFDHAAAEAYEDEGKLILAMFLKVDAALHSSSASPAVYRKVAEAFVPELKEYDITVHENDVKPYMRAALRYWGFYTD